MVEAVAIVAELSGGNNIYVHLCTMYSKFVLLWHVCWCIWHNASNNNYVNTMVHKCSIAEGEWEGNVFPSSKAQKLSKSKPLEFSVGKDRKLSTILYLCMGSNLKGGSPFEGEASLPLKEILYI